LLVFLWQPRSDRAFNHRVGPMASPNYSFEKRQRELAKKRRKEEKTKQRSETAQPTPAENDTQPSNVKEATS
jgi:hypothetical protein